MTVYFIFETMWQVNFLASQPRATLLQGLTVQNTFIFDPVFVMRQVRGKADKTRARLNKEKKMRELAKAYGKAS